VFQKILIANRGEIAVRIARTLREMDIRPVAIYTAGDRASLHVRKSSEATPVDSYLDIGSIIDAAKRMGAEAIHPGYGFLSENADFAAACEQEQIIFIGPPSSSIRSMGSKTGARKIAGAAGTPIIPGTPEGLTDPPAALPFAKQAGFPVMLKAVAGGGGKGMRRVDRETDLEAAFRDASSEADRAFRNPAIYVEKLIERPRHIEIQLIGDRHGNMIHLGERECSIQRRHQKVVEECPSPLVAIHPEMRDAMGAAAIKAAKAAGYYNAGTVEFLVDADCKFYFLEMNTRLQVEHPVTELVTGVDLVRMQVEVAAGGALGLKQEDVRWRGAALECRIYAEDPDNHFFPSPGKISSLNEPAGPGVRVDSGVYAGWTVPIDFDPMLAKLAVWAGSRDHTIARMQRAIAEYHVGGISTNLRFFAELLADEEMRAGNLDTHFLNGFFQRARNRGVDASGIAKLVSDSIAPQIEPRVSLPAWRLEGRNQLLR
jgi:acetyl-CoA carboxylase, biotin carboxylase subunit